MRMPIVLLIDGNVMAGRIPTEIGHCSGLMGLELNDNQLTGKCRHLFRDPDDPIFASIVALDS